MLRRLLLVVLYTLVILINSYEAYGGDDDMQITSPSFNHNEMIPAKFTCIGENVSPALILKNIPSAAESLVLIMDDPDAPVGTWVHWVVYDILPLEKIEEGGVVGVEGITSFRKRGYGGPCPPSGTHRYFFKVYALDKLLGFEEGKTKVQIEEAMDGHVLSYCELIGLFAQ